LVAARQRGEFVANYELAEREANASVDHAKLQFVGKTAKKLENATKNHPGTPRIGGYLSFNQAISGGLKVEFDSGDEFLLVLTIIVNHRYKRGHKSFYQFPARFGSVKLRGVDVKARFSEAWMEKNFK